MAPADFFTVEVWLPRGLTRFTVLVLIELATRRVEIAGITADPDGPWVTQLARNAPAWRFEVRRSIAKAGPRHRKWPAALARGPDSWRPVRALGWEWWA